MRKGKRRGSWVIIGLVLLISIGIVAFIGLNNTRVGMLKAANEVAILAIEDIGVKDIENGIYRGQWENGLVRAVVDVEVRDGAIDEITIVEHQNGLGEKGEGVISQVIDQQSLKVDAVAGATVSSRVILKAVEQALIAH